MELKLENPEGIAKPGGQYSHSVEVPGGARLIFVSGQVPVRPDGAPVSGLAEQADQVYANLVSILAAKGIDPSAIIKLTTFLVDDDPDHLVARARRRYLGEHRPASTLVWVKRLADPSWKVEVEAVAMADSVG